MKSFASFAAVAAAVTVAGCAPLSQGGGHASPWGGPQSGTAPVYGIPQAGAMQGTAGGVYGAAPGYGRPSGWDGRQQAAGPSYGQPSVHQGQPGAVPVAGQAPSLVDILVGRLGISSQQAMGGAGSIFSMAQQHLNPADFSQLGNAVPGMDQYLAAAPRRAAPVSGSGGLLGIAGAMMGGQGGTLGSLASLAGSFQSLGLNSGMVSQFVPLVLQYVQSQGGSAAMGLLQRALY
jgi:hypothetical protein